MNDDIDQDIVDSWIGGAAKSSSVAINGMHRHAMYTTGGNGISEVYIEDRLQQVEERIEDALADQNMRLEALEEHAACVNRDILTEEEFQELRAAWEQYNEVLDKLRTFKRLRDSV